MSLTKRFFSLMVFSIIIVFLNGCCSLCLWNVNEWKDDNPELFTLAVSSLLGTPGFEDDNLKVLETDDFGRVFFSYKTESAWIPGGKCFGLFISQKSDEEKVFFYPTVFFVEASEEEDIPDSRIETLLSDNDWGNPLDETKMDWLTIFRVKPEESISKPSTVVANAFWDQFEKTENDFGPDWFFQGRDREGRELFVLQTVTKDSSSEELIYGTLFFLVVLPDGTFDSSTCLMEIEDQWNFQEDLAVFLENNHWNDPLE